MPTQIPTRWEDENLFSERMADRLTKIERINERLQHEMENYKGNYLEASKSESVLSLNFESFTGKKVPFDRCILYSSIMCIYHFFC